MSLPTAPRATQPSKLGRLDGISGLVCMTGLKAGGVLGGPGQPGVSVIGSQQSYGITPHDWGIKYGTGSF
eukprot:922262-Pelagomonas_calceolata.AAC.16